MPWRTASDLSRLHLNRPERLVRPDAQDAIIFFPDVLIASCRIFQLSFVSNTQGNATHIKTALLLDRGDGRDAGCLC